MPFSMTQILMCASWILRRTILWVSLIRLHMALTAQDGGEVSQRDHGMRTEFWAQSRNIQVPRLLDSASLSGNWR